MNTMTRSTVVPDRLHQDHHPVVYVSAITVIAAALVAIAAVSDWAPWGAGQAAEAAVVPKVAAAAPTCFRCGTIEAIQRVEWGGSGLGMTGAMAGGQLGGREQALLVLLGTVGSVQAGNRADTDRPRPVGWRIRVRMEDGSLRDVDQRQAPAVAIGDRVRVIQGNVVARS